MTSQKPKPVNEQELQSLFHTLDLMRGQVKSERVEFDYMLRQINKVTTIAERMAETHREHESALRIEALYNVSRMLGTSLELQTVLNQVMDAVIQVTGAERGFLMLRDDDGDLQVEVARNLDQRTLTGEEFQYSHTIASLVLDNGDSVLTTNAVEDPRFTGQDSIMTHSLRSIMAAPLLARGAIIGIAYVENRAIAGMFSQADLTTLETLIGQAAMAIDNAILFSETDQALAKRIDELRELRRIDMKLSEKLDPDEAMLYTLETACRLANASGGHLGLLRSDPRRIEAIHHYHTEEGRKQERPINLDTVYPKVWDVIESGKTITFDSGLYGVNTVLIVPVILNREVIGVLVLKREDGGSFPEEQQDMIERVVTRAAVSIENARLYAAVQVADRAKSEFVGVVAHDLKAPMTSIQGYADLMLMEGGDLDARRQRFLTRISSTVNRMEKLVSDLADISRIEGGDFLIDQMKISVASVVDALRDTVTPQMEARKHTYVEDVQEDVPDMLTDYYRLVQILTNLLSNAYKYTQDGGTITLRVWQEEQRVHFAVSDTGIGLSKATIEKLGTKFFRAEDEYTRSQQGSGLGYSITARLVEQMGSKIDIESEVDKGSTFSFSIQTADES